MLPTRLRLVVVLPRPCCSRETCRGPAPVLTKPRSHSDYPPEENQNDPLTKEHIHAGFRDLRKASGPSVLSVTSLVRCRERGAERERRSDERFSMASALVRQ